MRTVNCVSRAPSLSTVVIRCKGFLTAVRKNAVVFHHRGCSECAGGKRHQEKKRLSVLKMECWNVLARGLRSTVKWSHPCRGNACRGGGLGVEGSAHSDLQAVAVSVDAPEHGLVVLQLQGRTTSTAPESRRRDDRDCHSVVRAHPPCTHPQSGSRALQYRMHGRYSTCR
jgi:hypothetical protein